MYKTRQSLLLLFAAHMTVSGFSCTKALAQTTSEASPEQTVSSDINICRSSLDTVAPRGCTFELCPADLAFINRLQEKQLRRFMETGSTSINPYLGFKEAKLAVLERRYDEADGLFKETIGAFNRSVNDAKLEGEVLSEYARFLRSRHRDAEAEQMVQLYKQYSAETHHFRDKKVPRDPSLGPETFDVRSYPPSFGFRSVRRIKTSPTLPEGAPIPDNE